MSLSPRHEEHASIPARPYRDSAIFYGILAAVIVGLAAISNSGLAKSVAVAAGFWVVATAWSWWRFRVRIKRRDAAAAAASASGDDGAAPEPGRYGR